MGNNKSNLMRASPKFVGEIKEIKLKRIKLGKDQELNPVKSARITLAITRHPLFKKIKDDIIINELK